jgi:hypothetical protein
MLDFAHEVGAVCRQPRASIINRYSTGRFQSLKLATAYFAQAELDRHHKK